MSGTLLHGLPQVHSRLGQGNDNINNNLQLPTCATWAACSAMIVTHNLPWHGVEVSAPLMKVAMLHLAESLHLNADLGCPYV